MKSVEVCSNLLEPLISEEGQRRLEHIKEESSWHYEQLIAMKNDLNIIYNDLLKFQGFISILEADKSLYERRVEYKKNKNLDFKEDEAILVHIKSQLSLLNI